jgi:hypothetical protein
MCDTKYALGGQHKEVTVSDLAQMIRAFDLQYVVFTGGEPLLNQSAIVAVMREAGFCRYKYGIESNCTIRLEQDVWNVVSRRELNVPSTCPGPLVSFTLSPKLGVPGAIFCDMVDVAQEVVNYCSRLSTDRMVELKFLVDVSMPDAQLGEQLGLIHTFLEKVHFAEGVPVILQVQTPQGLGGPPETTIEVIRRDYAKLLGLMQERKDMGLVALCHHKRMPLRVLPQLHVLTFGPNKRGV